jgi:hypothetical protein
LFTGRKMPLLFWGLAFFLLMVPDLDVFGFLWNIQYGSPFGHRGFTHSLCFALLTGLVAAGLTFRYFQVSFWDLWGFFFVKSFPNYTVAAALVCRRRAGTAPEAPVNPSKRCRQRPAPE